MRRGGGFGRERLVVFGVGVLLVVGGTTAIVWSTGPGVAQVLPFLPAASLVLCLASLGNAWVIRRRPPGVRPGLSMAARIIYYLLLANCLFAASLLVAAHGPLWLFVLIPYAWFGPLAVCGVEED